MIIIGIFSSIALSIARAIFSPTTEPIEPPINAKSITAMDTFKPLILPTAVLTASVKPLLVLEAFTRSG
jgi:glutamate mutase epsilon subunit